MSALVCCPVCLPPPSSSSEAQSEKLDYAMLGRIRDEGLEPVAGDGSRVVAQRCVRPPPHRLAGDPAGERLGDEEVHGVGADQRAPRALELRQGLVARPVLRASRSSRRFSRSSASRRNGRRVRKAPVTADVVRVQIANDGDFEKYRGKLAGKIVLAQPARQVRMLEGPIILRMDRQGRPRRRSRVPTAAVRGRWAAAEDEPEGGRGTGGVPPEGIGLLRAAKASSPSSIAAATATWRPAAATSRGSSSVPTAARSFPPAASARDDNAGKSVPVITLAVEHYNRMIRVLDKGLPVKVELNVETKFYDETTPNGFNTIAEICRAPTSRRRSCCSARISTRIRTPPAPPTTRPAAAR